MIHHARHVRLESRWTQNLMRALKRLLTIRSFFYVDIYIPTHLIRVIDMTIDIHNTTTTQVTYSSSRFSGNAEAFASTFLENLEEMFVFYSKRVPRWITTSFIFVLDCQIPSYTICSKFKSSTTLYCVSRYWRVKYLYLTVDYCDTDHMVNRPRMSNIIIQKKQLFWEKSWRHTSWVLHAA